MCRPYTDLYTVSKWNNGSILLSLWLVGGNFSSMQLYSLRCSSNFLKMFYSCWYRWIWPPMLLFLMIFMLGSGCDTNKGRHFATFCRVYDLLQPWFFGVGLSMFHFLTPIFKRTRKTLSVGRFLPDTFWASCNSIHSCDRVVPSKMFLCCCLPQKT